MPKPIRVISLDFDGCMFNEAFLDDPNKDVIAANDTLLAALIGESVNYQKSITFIGSNRQSLADDKSNGGYGKGSCFPAIRQISDFIDASFDNFLMADLYSKKEPGTAYTEAMRILNGERGYDQGAESEYEWLHDSGKLSILVAQMHKIAGEYPDEYIEFEFFDDRNDILNGLRDFFEQNRYFVPDNVNLKLSRYNGKYLNALSSCRRGLVENILNIQGKGLIINDYSKFVMDIADLGIENASKTDNPCVNDDALVTCSLVELKGNYSGATIDLVKQLHTAKLSDAAEETSKPEHSPLVTEADPSVSVSEKTSWWSRHKFKIALTVAAIIGAGVGIALVATGVFAPLGAGILGATAMAAIGAGSVLVTGAAFKGAEKLSQVIKTKKDKKDEVEAPAANVGGLRQSSYASMSSDLPAAPASSPASSPSQPRLVRNLSGDSLLWSRPTSSQSSLENGSQPTPENDLLKQGLTGNRL